MERLGLGYPALKAAKADIIYCASRASGRTARSSSIPPTIIQGLSGVIPDGRAVEAQLAAEKGRLIPMNIDGATGVIFAELGFAPPLCRGLFVLSRSVGALAHAFEVMQSGERNQAPIPRHLTWRYTGPPPRKLVDRRD